MSVEENIEVWLPAELCWAAHCVNNNCNCWPELSALTSDAPWTRHAERWRGSLYIQYVIVLHFLNSGVSNYIKMRLCCREIFTIIFICMLNIQNFLIVSHFELIIRSNSSIHFKFQQFLVANVSNNCWI